MSLFRTLFARQEAKAALAVWAILPTLFLFFAITLAVDPSTQLSKLRLGVAMLDSGVETPQGRVAIGNRLMEGASGQFPFEIVKFGSDAELQDAVLARDVAGGIVFPLNMTRDLQAQQPVSLRVVKSDANDPFTNAFIGNLATQMAANLNAALPGMLGGAPGAGQPPSPLVSMANDNVAASSDFRFGVVPATLVLPLWVATLAFSVLLSRAGNWIRREGGFGAVETGLTELAVGAAGAGLTAAVITLDIALFTWHWDLDFAGLFLFLWLGLLACAWLLQGAIRLFGLEIGALLGVLALFIQQPVSGAAFPSAFAPDVVRWAEGFSPLRFIVAGTRNLLIGGSTTPEMAANLALLGAAGLLLFAAGIARVALLPSRKRPPQPAPSV